MSKKTVLSTLVAFVLTTVLFSVTVLGQQIFNQSEAQASNPIIPIVYEMDDDNWQTSGLWNQLDGRWYYGQPGQMNYNTGKANAGELITPGKLITVSDNYEAKFSFQSKLNTEESPFYDVANVQIKIGNGEWKNLEANVPDTATFQEKKYDITSHVKGNQEKVFFKLSFDTKDQILNDYEGWLVENIYAELIPLDQPQVKILESKISLVSQNPHSLDQSALFDITIKHSDLIDAEKIEVLNGNGEVVGLAQFKNMAGILCFEDGTCASGTTFATFTWDQNSDIPPTIGTHQISVRAWDKQGNSAQSLPVEVIIEDSGAPAVLLTSPQPGKYNLGETVTLEAEMNLILDLETLDFYSGDNWIGKYEAIMAPDCGPNVDCVGLNETFVLDWNQNSAYPTSAGKHQVYALAKDTNGFEYKSNVIEIEIIDNNWNCTTDYVPVCGTNGQTYSNQCVFDNTAPEGTEVAYAGECEPMLCVDPGPDMDTTPLLNIIKPESGAKVTGEVAIEVEAIEFGCFFPGYKEVWVEVFNGEEKIGDMQIPILEAQTFIWSDAPQGTHELTFKSEGMYSDSLTITVGQESLKLDQIQLIETELGECNENNKGTIKYSQDDFYGCKSTGWVKLS